MRMFTTRCQKS